MSRLMSGCSPPSSTNFVMALLQLVQTVMMAKAASSWQPAEAEVSRLMSSSSPPNSTTCSLALLLLKHIQLKAFTAAA